ncbi:MAG: hypothetical protein K6T51_12020 [Rubrobacteraceae bacterium]|uniref:hypothetical protein n=1 Tax=Rubrobacter naiadicus TaxID=1392641 RepID=UPI002362E1F3|nr:hypothetical protein [Rubrobacter naiadicus]MBX6762761.1 hypothetical protein [Rubrobacteraceae bacterium]MCL6439327.1 hypothetical protein [Rubrobacteraceae bacterium]
MEMILSILNGISHFVPFAIAFYVPALFGMAIWREKTRGYMVKAGLWFVIGFGLILAFRLMLDASVLQDIETFALSLAQMAVALFFANLTVYRLAD